MGTKLLNVLLVEDNPGDSRYIQLIATETTGVPIQFVQVDSLASALTTLDETEIDVVLLDLGLPDSFGLGTLRSIRTHNSRIPIVVLTGHDDSELAIKAVSEGAQDYLVKGQLDNQLVVRSIRYAIERQKLLLKLQDAFAEVKRLKALLPICSHCKKIRDDDGYWQAVEEYVGENAGVQFSHTLCPVCLKKLYPADLVERVLKKSERDDS
jgi:DNA-binding response OmpR family regulator